MIETKIFMSRTDVQKNRDKVFVFGDNMARCGNGGQAAACRFEWNTVGIPTKWEPNYSDGAFFSDNDYDRVAPIINGEFMKLQLLLDNGVTIVWPADGIGTGRSQLKKRAPKIWNMIQDLHKALLAYQG
jgi:hypothetical protein